MVIGNLTDDLLATEHETFMRLFLSQIARPLVCQDVFHMFHCTAGFAGATSLTAAGADAGSVPAGRYGAIFE